MLPTGYTIGVHRGNYSEAQRVEDDYDLKKGQLYEVQDSFIQVFEAEYETIWTRSKYTEQEIAFDFREGLIAKGEKPIWIYVIRVEDEPLALYVKFRIDYQAIHGDKGTPVHAVLLAITLIKLLVILTLVVTAVIVLIYFIFDPPDIDKFTIPVALILGVVVFAWVMASKTHTTIVKKASEMI